MKVVAKFAAVFFVVSCLCLFAYGYVNARRETAELARTVSQDLGAFGEGLRAAVEATWLTQGEQQALNVVHAAESRRSDIELLWIPARSGTSPDLSPEGATDDARMLSVTIPVLVRQVQQGSIVVRRRVPDERAAFRAALVDELAVATLLALLGGVLAVTLGGSLIGRPLQRVVEQARRIGSGDLSGRLAGIRRDEIGDLKRAINLMCDQLVVAQERIEAESTARIETLEQLRHLDRLRTVGTIASSLAHELGTPLNVLLLRGQSMAAGDLAPDEIGDTGATIVTQVAKMSTIVRQLLDFSRRAPAKREVRVSDVIRQVTSLLGSLAKKARVDLKLDVSDDATVLVEQAQLEQAVTNLVINAIHAMPHGGTLWLRARTTDAACASKTAAPTRAATIDVQDEGVGIAPDRLEKIFEPFYTTKAAGEGTGLGLSVARGIAEDHGGWMSAKSELGRGSTFTLYLPCRR